MYVERTVRSVLLQRYPNLEYILMDGGSSDDTLDRLRPYWHQFAYAVSQKDDGQAAAIHAGFQQSTGDIMAYLNSDDMLAPGALRFVAEFFDAHPDIDAVYSHRVTVDADDIACSYWILPPHSNYLMMRWDLIPQETCFWRRRLFEQCGNIDPSFRFAMDYDLFVRYMKVGRWKRVNRFLGAFRYHESAKTTTLLYTVGHQEIDRVREKHAIPVRGPRHWLGDRFSRHVRDACPRFIQSGKVLPGALPGIGWDYNDLWGGLLRDTCMPPCDAQGANAAPAVAVSE